jgi:pimeloyl-ACP methyl ester carboxylesterase
MLEVNRSTLYATRGSIDLLSAAAAAKGSVLTIPRFRRNAAFMEWPLQTCGVSPGKQLIDNHGTERGGPRGEQDSPMKEPIAEAGRERGLRDLHVVLLHGQPGAGSDWDAVVRALPPHLRGLALDRPGYRTSPHPPGSFDENAQWLLAELDRAGVEDAIVVGHSYGGGVALTAAALAPDRIRGLVLVASVGPGCLDHWDALLAAPVAGEICAVTAWLLTPWFARKRLARIERIRNRPLEPDEHVSWETWGNAGHEHGAIWRTFLTEQRELVRNIDQLAGRLEQISVPSVVIADPADKMIPIATANALRDRLPHARLVLVGEGGHNLPRRIPEVVADTISDFAGSLD